MKHEYMETWTGQEDALLLRLVQRHGTSWKTIGKCMPDRTASSMRNRYKRIVNGQHEGGKNRCHKCGQIKRGHICGRVDDDCESIASSATTDDVLLLSPLPNTVHEEPCPEEDEETTDTEEDSKESASFPDHLLCWFTVQTAHDMGFEDVKHPPPLIQQFPFVTSLPC